MACPGTVAFQKLVAGQLAGDERASVADHAATCPACHALVNALVTQHGHAGSYGGNVLAIGSVIGSRFRIDDILGVGGMGIVVAATHLELGTRVALKFLRDEMAGSAAISARLVREARAIANLKTPHVCKVSDVARLPSGAPYIVMELLEGSDLARVVANGPVPVATAVGYVLQACAALGEAHAAGLVHRDLKPGNLFLTRTGMLKVLDFGIAKALLDDAGLTLTQVTLGSPGYMSPEQIESASQVDARTDIWALGVTLYELVSGRRPFRGASQTEIAIAVTTESPAPLAVDPALRTVIMRCLEKQPARRYPDVASLAADLTRIGASSAQVAVPAVGVASGPPRRERSRAWLAVLAAVGLGAIAVTVAIKLAGRTTESAPSAPIAATPPGPAQAPNPAPASPPPPAIPVHAPAVAITTPPAGHPTAPRPPPGDAGAQLQTGAISTPAGPKGCDLTGPAVAKHSGSINTDETWAGVHDVTGTVEVRDGTLTIAPCSLIRLAPNASIELRAAGVAVVAKGDPQHPIRFAPQVAGQPWGHLLATAPGRIELAYATLEGGGTAGTFRTADRLGATVVASGERRSLSVDHVTISGSSGLGVFMDRGGFAAGSHALTITRAKFFPLLIGADAAATIPDGSYTGNATDELLLQSAATAAMFEQQRSIAADAALHDRGVPYRVGGEIRVVAHGRLAIDAGVTLRFTGASKLTVTGGALVAAGTAQHPVTFTSASSQPAAGDWPGLVLVNPEPRSRIDHAVIEYAGGRSGTTGVCPWRPDATDFRADAALILRFDTPPPVLVTNTAIKASAGAGIYRGWRGADVDFAAGNTFSGIAGCLQTNVPDDHNACPKTACAVQ